MASSRLVVRTACWPAGHGVASIRIAQTITHNQHPGAGAKKIDSAHSAISLSGTQAATRIRIKTTRIGDCRREDGEDDKLINLAGGGLTPRWTWPRATDGSGAPVISMSTKTLHQVLVDVQQTGSTHCTADSNHM